MVKGKARDGNKEAAWRRRLRQQAGSGQSVRAWCHMHRLTETAFYWWRRELARRDTEQATSRDTKVPGHNTSSFVPVHVMETPLQDGVQRCDAGQMEIVLTDGRRVRLAGPVNREHLTVVLDVLERRTC